MKNKLEELKSSLLPSEWFEQFHSSMIDGNMLHDHLFDGEARNLDVEDAVETCGVALDVSSYEQSIDFDLRSGDLHPLVTTLQDRAALHQRQVAVMVSQSRSVAIVFWESGSCAVIDSHTHGQYGAIISFATATHINHIATWISQMTLKYYNAGMGLCTLTFISFV